MSEQVKVIWAFEKATLAGLVNEQFEDPLRERRPIFDGLTGHRVYDYDGIMIGDDLQVGALHFSTGDVVCKGFQAAGEVVLCCEQAGAHLLIVKEFVFLEQVRGSRGKGGVYMYIRRDCRIIRSNGPANQGRLPALHGSQF